jgi:hypothetical protein
MVRMEMKAGKRWQARCATKRLVGNRLNRAEAKSEGAKRFRRLIDMGLEASSKDTEKPK